MSNSDSDSDDHGHTQSRAFVVKGIPSNFDPNKPPASAEEYLQQVMYEAKKLDSVVTVKLDKSRIRKQAPVIKRNIKMVAPAGYAPDLAAQKLMIQQFLEVKANVQRMRASNPLPRTPVKLPVAENPDHWCRFCFGNTFQRSLLLKQQADKQQQQQQHQQAAAVSSSDSSGNSDSSDVSAGDAVVEQPPAPSPSLPDAVEGSQPLMSIMVNIKQTTIQHLMEWHVGWLEVTGFSEHQGKWLYSLLALLATPLIPELCDNVRQMVYLCAKARAQLESASHPFLPQLNLLITIVTRHFSQEDLADPR